MNVRKLNYVATRSTDKFGASTQECNRHTSTVSRLRGTRNRTTPHPQPFVHYGDHATSNGRRWPLQDREEGRECGRPVSDLDECKFLHHKPTGDVGPRRGTQRASSFAALNPINGGQAGTAAASSSSTRRSRCSNKRMISMIILSSISSSSSRGEHIGAHGGAHTGHTVTPDGTGTAGTPGCRVAHAPGVTR